MSGGDSSFAQGPLIQATGCKGIDNRDNPQQLFTLLPRNHGNTVWAFAVGSAHSAGSRIEGISSVTLRIPSAVRHFLKSETVE